MRRVATALVLIPTVLYVIFAGPSWLLATVVCLLAVACFHEYAGIVTAQGVMLERWAGQAMGLVFLLVAHPDWRWLVGFTLVAMTLALRVPDLAGALGSASAMMLGLLYVFGAWRCAFPLREASPWWLFFATGLNWVGDTAALYSGKTFGKRKLAPVISPKKTWEGSAGSLAFSMLFGAALLAWALPDVPVWHGLLLSGVTNVAGQVGDLAESALKRGAGVKDSGTLLPGHGGWLDRLDSTLFTLPVVASYLEWVGKL